MKKKHLIHLPKIYYTNGIFHSKKSVHKDYIQLGIPSVILKFIHISTLHYNISPRSWRLKTPNRDCLAVDTIDEGGISWLLGKVGVPEKSVTHAAEDAWNP